MADKIRTVVWVADTDLRIRLVNIINRTGKYNAIEYRSGAGELEGVCLQKPELLLVDIDYAVEKPKKLIPQLRSSLPRIPIIGLSSRWDERKRQELEGLFDALLLMPFDAESFTHAVEEAQRTVVRNKGEVFSFFSPKGKSGRTTLIVNLAVSLARLSGERVAIIDAETNFADMETFLNLKPKSTIVEALRDLSLLSSGTLAKYYEEVVSNVEVLCGAQSVQKASLITPEALKKLIEMSRRSFGYVLVDLAPGFSPVTMAACETSDKVYLTTMSGGTFELKHLKRSLEIFKAMDNWEKRVECVITRITPELRQRTLLEEEMGCPVTLIPNEYHLCAQAANNGRMATDIGPRTALVQQIDLMAHSIIEKSR